MTTKHTAGSRISVAVDVLDDHLWPPQSGWGEEMQRAIDVLHAERTVLQAAPELLEAVKLAAVRMERMFPQVAAEFRAIIHKAEGRS